jgi:PTH1 family peptidyl-tRNA hydrolase
VGDKLIVGLGNPGSEYKQTRHNVGFLVLDALAESLGWEFRQEKKFFGNFAKGPCEGGTLFLLQPMTYMNESGRAVRKMIDYYKISQEEVFVVCDDVVLALGELRLRTHGSAGGHNGLKSIQAHLGTQHYPRLRIGVGDREHGSLSGHVLGRFSSEEKQALPDLIKRGKETLSQWAKGERLELLMNVINRKTKAKPPAPKEPDQPKPPIVEAGEKQND